MSSDLNDDWREFAELTYNGQIRGPVSRRLATADPKWAAKVQAEQTRRAELEASLEARTGIGRGVLRANASDAAGLHGSDPGSDQDPDRFGPPDWDALHAEHQAGVQQDAEYAAWLAEQGIERDAEFVAWLAGPDAPEHEPEVEA